MVYVSAAVTLHSGDETIQHVNESPFTQARAIADAHSFLLT